MCRSRDPSLGCLSQADVETLLLKLDELEALILSRWRLDR
jgi:hypothetical protein